jgi:hypothetical protein
MNNKNESIFIIRAEENLLLRVNYMSNMYIYIYKFISAPVASNRFRHLKEMSTENLNFVRNLQLFVLASHSMFGSGKSITPLPQQLIQILDIVLNNKLMTIKRVHCNDPSIKFVSICCCISKV